MYEQVNCPFRSFFDQLLEPLVLAEGEALLGAHPEDERHPAVLPCGLQRGGMVEGHSGRAVARDDDQLVSVLGGVE